jgi:hypothetical protein
MLRFHPISFPSEYLIAYARGQHTLNIGAKQEGMARALKCTGARGHYSCVTNKSKHNKKWDDFVQLEMPLNRKKEALTLGGGPF